MRIKALLTFGPIVIGLCLVTACAPRSGISVGQFSGSHLVFDSHATGGIALTQVGWDSDGEMVLRGTDYVGRFPIYLGNVATGTVSPLVLRQTPISGAHPALSPGREFVAVYDVDLRQMQIVHVSDPDQPELVLPFGYAVDWSPDGSQVAVIGKESDVVSIRLFDLEGQEVARVFETSDDQIYFYFADWSIAWSPDGARIAFLLGWRSSALQGELQSDIFVLSLLTGDVIRLTDTPLMDDTHPSWSPDSIRLVFETTPADGSQRDSQLAFANADGSCIRVASVPFGAGGPSWSPDGDHVAVIFGESVYILDIASLDDGLDDSPLVCP